MNKTKHSKSLLRLIWSVFILKNRESGKIQLFWRLGFTNLTNGGIIKEPDKLNILNEVFFCLKRERNNTFFCRTDFLEFGKNANSAKLVVAKDFFLVPFQLVWRQLEFAFFGALTSVGALFIFTLGSEAFKSCSNLSSVVFVKQTVGKLDLHLYPLTN